jgi:hypothetical protein
LAGLHLSWSPGSSQHRASVGFNSDNQSSSDYSYRSEGELGFNAQAVIRKSDRSLQQDANIGYMSERLDAQVAVDQRKSASGQTTLGFVQQ